jgi:hypothetical protein
MTYFTTFVSYCSRERFFLKTLVENAVVYSNLVVVAMGSKLYTGEAEAEDDIEYARTLCESLSDERCTVMMVLYTVTDRVQSDPVYFHNQARSVAYDAATQYFSNTPFWVLFLDGDEIPDGVAFKEWLAGAQDTLRRSPNTVVKFNNYWGFLHPRLVAEKTEDSVLMAHCSVLNGFSLSHIRERDGIYMWHAESPIGNKRIALRRCVPGKSDMAMFWHFSWVRSTDGYATMEGLQQGLKNKVANWGHTGNAEWEKVIDSTFERMVKGEHPDTDFVHGYKLKFVDLPSYITCFQQPITTAQIPIKENTSTA